MSTSPIHEARPAVAPPAAPAPASRRRRTPTREELLSARIRRSTIRRRLSQATDALAVVDLLLGMNRSVEGMGRGDES